MPKQTNAKRYTNSEILNPILAETNKSALKSHFASKDGNPLTDEDIAKFAEDLPTQVRNELLEDLVNKIVSTTTYEPLEGFENPFDYMFKEGGEFGDTEEEIAVGLYDSIDYSASESSTDLDPVLPDLDVSYVYTTDKKYWKISVPDAIVKAAFVSPYGFDSLIARITGKLMISRNLYIYEAVKGGLRSGIETEKEITAITAVGQTVNTQKFVEELMTYALKMAQPSDDFNEAGETAASRMGSMTLIVNASYLAAMKSNYYAAFFNASKELGLDKVFKRVIVIEFASGDTALGYILDEQKYKITNRILQTESIRVPSKMLTNVFLHNWLKRGVIPFLNGIKLVARSEPTQGGNAQGGASEQ